MSFPDRTTRGRRRILFAALGASAGVALGLSSAAPTHTRLRDAPPLGHTGGFGEPTCRQCHWDNDLNHPGGALSVDGLPARFQPGIRYRLTVVVRHGELGAAGFQLSARYDDGSPRGRQAGTFRALDDRVGTTTNDTTAVQYAHHVRRGTAPAERGVGRWMVEWRAPPAPRGPVTFHIAANAANDNDSEIGDYVYLRAVTVPSAEK